MADHAAVAHLMGAGPKHGMRWTLAAALTLLLIACASPDDRREAGEIEAPARTEPPQRAESTTAAVQDPPASAGASTASDSTKEAEPQAEFVAEPEPEPTPEPKSRPVPEPVATPAPEAPAPDPTDEAEPASTALRTEPALAPMPEPKLTTEPSPVPTSDSRRSGAGVSARLSGTVQLSGGRAELTETVVYFVPETEVPTPAPGTFELATEDKAFLPTVLVVPRGSLVRFPNRDPILHNVFSVSADNAFDLGVYGPGSIPDTTFENTGAVNVYCNVHHDMHAHVLVLDTPWYQRVDTDGRFALNGLPAGPGTLHVWHRQAEPWSMDIEASNVPAVELEIGLDIVRPQLPEHLDKTGQSYLRRDRDPYR